jgi:tetratricopeptide (TPR) repeat protein
LGTLRLDVGQYEQAQSYTEEVLAICRQIDHRFGQILALVNLGLGSLYQSNYQQAYENSQEAFEMAKAIKHLPLQGLAQMSLGRSLAGLRNLNQAQTVFWEVLALSHELDQSQLGLEAKAGLAWVSKEEGQGQRAMGFVEEIWRHLESGGNLEGTESPFWVYWRVYEVLKEKGDDRARAVLLRANSELEARAAGIADEGMRQSFMSQIPIHKQLIEAFRHIS